MTVFRKLLGVALASTVLAAAPAAAATQVNVLNGGLAITVPPSVQFMTNMLWATNDASATGVVEFNLGSSLALSAAGFVNSGISQNIFDFSNIHLYSGSFTANGGTTAGLSVISLAGNEVVTNNPGNRNAWLLPTVLSTGLYSLVYTGASSNITNGQTALDGANVNGNVSFEAVPEAATWMMMVAGFGIMGAAMRRRPRTQVTFA